LYKVECNKTLSLSPSFRVTQERKKKKKEKKKLNDKTKKKENVCIVQLPYSRTEDVFGSEEKKITKKTNFGHSVALAPRTTMSDNTINVLLGSGSHLKYQAVSNAFANVFPNSTVNVYKMAEAKSGINEQPVGHAETLLGARNRIASAELAAAEKCSLLLPSVMQSR
jgi:hypothetical protein